MIRTAAFLFLISALALIPAYSFARTLSLQFIGIETQNNELYWRDGDSYVPVEIAPYSASPYTNVNTDALGNITLYRKYTSEGSVRYKKAVSTKVKPGLNKGTAVYLYTQSGEASLLIYDDSLELFPGQSIRIINLSPVRISSKVGDDVFHLDPYQSHVARVENLGKRPIVKVITVYKDGEGEWTPIYNKPTAILADWRLTGMAVVTKGGLVEAIGAADIIDRPGHAKLEFFTLKENL